MHLDYSIAERIGVSMALFLSLYGGVHLFTRIQRYRLRRSGNDSRLDSEPPTSAPRLLYFWTEECAPCRAQEREINQASKRLEMRGVHLAIEKLNAHSEKLFTDRFNIMTVPTTVVLDSNGAVVGWNPGLTRAERLIGQVAKSIATPKAKQTA